MLRIARGWWQKSPVTRESAKKTVKTIARGMPGRTGVTVVTMLVCLFYFAYEAAGALGARHSLRPLMRGEGFLQRLGHVVPRERGSVGIVIPGLVRMHHSGMTALSCCLKTESENCDVVPASESATRDASTTIASP